MSDQPDSNHSELDDQWEMGGEFGTPNNADHGTGSVDSLENWETDQSSTHSLRRSSSLGSRAKSQRAEAENESSSDAETKLSAGQEWTQFELIGMVSSYWKTAGLTFLGGSIAIIVGILSLVGYGMYTNSIFLYVVTVCTILYFISRLAGCYYIYQDCKILTINSINARRTMNTSQDVGMKPRSLLWASSMFFVPPFVHYAPFIVYLFRRHMYTGVP